GRADRGRCARDQRGRLAHHRAGSPASRSRIEADEPVNRRRGMTHQWRFVWCRDAILPGIALACVLGTALAAEAQALKDVQTPDAPLVLKAQGSFFVGGE